MAFEVECVLIRKGGTVVELGENTYHFTPNEAGAHVADVEDTDDLATFLGIKESYRIYKPKEPVKPKEPAKAAEPVKPVPAVELKEPAAKPAKGSKKAGEPTAPPDTAPLGLNGAADDLSTKSREEIVAIFADEMGRAASEHAEVEVMIAQIKAKREETQAG